MPIIKSAKKRVRTTEKKTAINRQWKDKVRDAIKEMEGLIEKGDLKAAEEKLPETKSILDKAVNKNILHKNNASRKKSRLTRMLNKLKENN
ncbi:MAG: 30S ribosomal protein S20 [bacterium]